MPFDPNQQIISVPSTIPATSGYIQTYGPTQGPVWDDDLSNMERFNRLEQEMQRLKTDLYTINRRLNTHRHDATGQPLLPMPYGPGDLA